MGGVRGSQSIRRAAVVFLAVSLVVGAVGPHVGGVGGSDGASHPDAPEVREAIADSRSYLFSAQEPYGDHWASNVTMGIFDVRSSLFYAALLERLDARPDSKQRALEWALSRRAEGGGWNDSVSNYLGILVLENVDAERYGDAIADVEAENERLNYSLTDGDAFQTFFESDLHVRVLYLAMSDRYGREELFDEDAVDRRNRRLVEMTPAFEDGFAPNESFVIPSAINTMLAVGVLTYETRENPSNRTEEVANRSRELLLATRLASGEWAMTKDNLLGVLALTEAGYTADDPEIARVLTYLEEKRQAPDGRLMPYKLPVWDTAFAMTALHESGVDPSNDSMQRAAKWLWEARTAPLATRDADTPLDRHPVLFGPYLGGGWGYKPYVHSDWDDTAAAIEAMSIYHDRIVDDQIAFLFDVQNEDGSWSGLATDFSPLNESEKRQVIEWADEQFYEVFFTNQPSPDVTGHALLALGANGYTVENNESVRAAVRWLLDNDDAEGGWEGVWGRGYTYGTSRALLGMEAVGADMDRPAVDRAAGTILALQRPDGSWGIEGSSPTHTAWALEALLAADVSPDHPAVRRGVRYLLDAQRADGSWETDRMMHNWGTLHYSLSVFTQAAGLKALVAYADATGIEYEPNGGDDGDGERSMVVPLVAAVPLFAVFAWVYVIGGRNRRRSR